MKKFNVFTLLVFLLAGLHAQNLHFSQFNENPALINPALTGSSNPFKAALSYREQWRSITAPYKSFGVNVESRFSKSKTKLVSQTGGMYSNTTPVGRFGMGLSAYTDKAGDGGLGQTRGNLSLSTFIPSGRKSFIAMGLQASLVQRRLDHTKLIFPSQFNGAVYDPNLSQNENFSGQNYTYGDFGAGVLWSYAQDESRIALNDFFKAHVGFGMFHLNRPIQKFTGVLDQRASMRFTANGDFLICKAQTEVAYAPSYLMHFQGKSREIVFGLLVKRFMKDNSKYTGLVKRSSVNFGAFYRTKDALILCIQYEKQERYAIGMSYDLNLSSLSNATYGRGGFELSMKFTPENHHLFKKKASPDSQL